MTEGWRDAHKDLKSIDNTLEELRQRNSSKPSNNVRYLKNYEFAWDEASSELPEGWSFLPLGNVCQKITDGTHDTPKPTKTGIPFIMAKHIRDKVIDFNNSLFVPQDVHNIIYQRCNPEKGDLILVHIGANIGSPAYINVDFEFSMKNVGLLKPHRELLDGKYLELYLLFIKQNIIDLVSRGGAQPFMSIKLMDTIPCVLPPLTEQYEIVHRVGLLFERADAFDREIAAASRRCERLTQAVLGKAFAGKLVERSVGK